MPLTNSMNVPESVKSGKGIFPYGYLTTPLVLAETHLPNKEAFYDELTNSHISDNDYARAIETWEAFDCHTIEDYMCAYLRLDVYQLADVFQNFRKLSLKEDGLDPIHYFSTPALSWDSAFKSSGVEIHLLLEHEQYEFFLPRTTWRHDIYKQALSLPQLT